MAIVRSTTRLTTKGETPDTVEMAPIFEVMRASGVIEPRVNKEGNTPEGSGSDAEASIDQEDPNILRPNKSSHIEFGESILKLEDLDVLKRLGYISEKLLPGEASFSNV